MDQELIATAVTRLVCSKCGHEMDVEGHEAFTTVACEKCQTALTVPVMLGSFLLLQKMGAGGMGSVYRALDTSLNRFVAIKVMKAALGEDAKLVESFIREARAAAALNHRNIVQIYSCGQEKGQPYIVMELVTGGKMNQLFTKEKPMDEVELLKMAIDVAEGLSAANAVGLVHGDIKPENVLIDASGTAKIVDFGLAQFVNAQKDRGEIWGTPYYISPERARGNQADHRSDIYSLGATMFHALAGIPPFDGLTPVDVVLARLKFPPPALGELRHGLQKETIDLIDRMMAPDPYLRYPTSESLKSDIRSALEAAKVAKSVGAHPRARAKNLPSIIIAIVAVVLIAVVGYTILSKVREAKDQPVILPPKPGRTVVTPREEAPPPAPVNIKVTFRLLGEEFSVEVPAPVARYLRGQDDKRTGDQIRDEWPDWFETLEQFRSGLRTAGEGELAAAQQHMQLLLERDGDAPPWVASLRPVAVTLQSAWSEVEAARTTARAQIDAGDLDAARETIRRYAEGKPDMLAGLMKPVEEAIATLVAAAKAAEADASARAHREKVQIDLDRVDDALAGVTPAALRTRDFRRAALTLSNLPGEMTTPEGKDAARLVREQFELLDRLKAYLIAQANSFPFTRAEGCDLNGDLVAATTLGVRLTLDGRAVITQNWDAIPVRSLVRIVEYYTARESIPADERATALAGLALFSLMSGSLEAANQYGQRALDLVPARAAEFRRLMPGVLP